MTSPLDFPISTSQPSARPSWKTIYVYVYIYIYIYILIIIVIQLLLLLLLLIITIIIMEFHEPGFGISLRSFCAHVSSPQSLHPQRRPTAYNLLITNLSLSLSLYVCMCLYMHGSIYLSISLRKSVSANLGETSRRGAQTNDEIPTTVLTILLL